MGCLGYSPRLSTPGSMMFLEPRPSLSGAFFARNGWRGGALNCGRPIFPPPPVLGALHREKPPLLAPQPPAGVSLVESERSSFGRRTAASKHQLTCHQRAPSIYCAMCVPGRRGRGLIPTARQLRAHDHAWSSDFARKSPRAWHRPRRRRSSARLLDVFMRTHCPAWVPAALESFAAAQPDSSGTGNPELPFFTAPRTRP